MNYMDEFLRLKCAVDVLNVVNPIGNKPVKEISESMAIIKGMKRVVFRVKPNTYSLFDVGAGNAITSVLAQHLLPLSCSWAIDKRLRNRNWSKVNQFIYCEVNFKDFMEEPRISPTPVIMIGVHSCKELSKEIINAFNENLYIKHLFLMPCCEGSFKSVMPSYMKENLSKAVDWVYYLYDRLEVKDKDIIQDKKCLSPKNLIIEAHRE